MDIERICGKNGKLYEYEIDEFWNMDNVDLNEILMMMIVVGTEKCDSE